MSDSSRQRDRRRLLRLPQAVAIRGRTFADDYDGDSIPSDFFERGATLPSLASAAPAPFYVHRFRDELLPLVPPVVQGFDLEHLSNGFDLALRRRRVAWGAQKAKAPVRSRLLALHSWREFNRLRLDKRTSTCVRRAVRRNVMFARGLAGRRGLGRQGVRRSVHSSWSC